MIHKIPVKLLVLNIFALNVEFHPQVSDGKDVLKI
jgi:hypothetical protein